MNFDVLTNTKIMEIVQMIDLFGKNESTSKGQKSVERMSTFFFFLRKRKNVDIRTTIGNKCPFTSIVVN